MGLNSQYYTGFSLEETFLDKNTGEPLAGGIVSFYQDNARTTPKLVYELSGAPPNYTYTALANPITLSSVGTIQDNAGNNIALYAFPFDSNGDLQLYYVTVTDAFGNEQFTREAWPNQAFIDGANTNSIQSFQNLLTNPTFAVVSFPLPGPLTISSAIAATLNVAIAPSWTLNVTFTAAGTVTVARTSIAGNLGYPFNPPYTLTVTPGANVSALSLTQQLLNNPDIWSPAALATNGWIASSILLAPNSSVIMQYAPSVGASQTILTENNLTGAYAQYSNTVQLAVASNTATSDTGYVNINIILPIGSATTLSNVQALGVQSDIAVVYDETPVNRQIANLSEYYNGLLEYKPIPSYLIGWDFALNPAQPLTSSCGPFNTGANTSNYIWDQTILFQVGNNNLSAARNAANQSLNIIAGADADSFALIQYLGEDEIRDMLQNPLSVNVAGISGGFSCCISLWYTTAGSLPNMGANASLVATLSATGKPATFNGAWTEIPRSNLGDAIFVMGPTATQLVVDHPFTGWNLNGATGTNTATFFAIVVGCALVGANQSIDFHSISCVPGNIPTRPAPQSLSAVYQECKRYYRKSFLQGTLPVQQAGTGTGDFVFPSTKAGATAGSISPTVAFEPFMRATPVVTLYNPLNADAQVLDQTSTVSTTASTTANLTTLGFYLSYTGDAGMAVGGIMSVHYTADARYGIV